MSPPGHEPVPGRGAPSLPAPLFHQRVLPCHALFLVPPAPLLQGDSLQRDAGIILAPARAGAVAVFFHSSLSWFTLRVVGRCFVLCSPVVSSCSLSASTAAISTSTAATATSTSTPVTSATAAERKASSPKTRGAEPTSAAPLPGFLDSLGALAGSHPSLSFSHFSLSGGSSKNQCSQEAATPQRFASLECRCPCLRCEPLWHHDSSPSLCLPPRRRLAGCIIRSPAREKG